MQNAPGGGGGHSAILLTFIKLPFVIKIFVLSIFEWPHKTDFTVTSKFYILIGKQFFPDQLASDE